MLEVNEMSYAAIITIDLPGMRHPATVSLTLTPPDMVETAPGTYRALRDCTLADIEAFAETMEAKLWDKYHAAQLEALAAGEGGGLKITLLNERGKALALSREDVLQHAIQIVKVDDAPTQAPIEDDATPQERTDQVLEDAEGDVGDQAVSGEPEDEPDAAPPVGDVAAGAGEAVEAPPPSTQELRIAGLRRPLGHPTTAAGDILINEAAFRDAQAHALSSLDREVAGMLIGPRPEKQPDGRYVVHISDVIIARHTRMMGASVTYTPESWRYVSDRLQELYPDEGAVIVGWYHTHPGFGIFLSGMDLFIHQHFFTQKWHVALVLDPRACRMGFFCWDRTQSEIQPYSFPWPDWAPDGW